MLYFEIGVPRIVECIQQPGFNPLALYAMTQQAYCRLDYGNHAYGAADGSWLVLCTSGNAYSKVLELWGTCEGHTLWHMQGWDFIIGDDPDVFERLVSGREIAYGREQEESFALH